MLGRRDVLKVAGISVAIAARRSWAAPPEFWEAKPPAEWTGDEVHSILTDSPWATTGLVRDAGVERLNTSAPWTGLPTKTKPWKVTVRWESAPPIQAALHSPEEVVNEEFQKYYVISLAGDARVTGLLVADRELGGKLLVLRSNTKLEQQNAPPLELDKLEEVLQEPQRALWFYFSRRRVITAAAGYLYFGTMIGRFQVMAKFDAGKMLYHGRLAV